MILFAIVFTARLKKTNVMKHEGRSLLKVLGPNLRSFLALNPSLLHLLITTCLNELVGCRPSVNSNSDR